MVPVDMIFPRRILKKLEHKKMIKINRVVMLLLRFSQILDFIEIKLILVCIFIDYYHTGITSIQENNKFMNF